MACLTEVLGLALPYCATAPAVDARRRRIAQNTGKRVVELIRDEVTPRAIVTEAAFRNAITLDMLIGGQPTLHCTFQR